jgi:hypothetical protein
MDHMCVDDDKWIASPMDWIWTCDSWEVSNLYAKSQLLQADTFKKGAIPLLEKKLSPSEFVEEGRKRTRMRCNGLVE